MDQELTLQDANYLNKEDKRTLALSSLGGALEFYDFVIYVFYAKIISDLFSPARLALFGPCSILTVFCGRLLFRPLGGSSWPILVTWSGAKVIFAFYFTDGTAYSIYRDIAYL